MNKARSIPRVEKIGRRMPSSPDTPCCHADEPTRLNLIETALAKLGDIDATSISSHPRRCCRVAREWFRAQARAHHAVSGLPGPWLRRHWRWGPQHHPSHWCEIMALDTIDCSTLASLTCESLRAVDEPVATVQMIEHFDAPTLRNWARRWGDHGGDYWLAHAANYHVAVAVRGPGPRGIRVWNPSVECFTEQRPTRGYGSIAAVRVVDDACPGLSSDGRYEWRGLTLRAGQWTLLPA